MKILFVMNVNNHFKIKVSIEFVFHVGQNVNVVMLKIHVLKNVLHVVNNLKKMFVLNAKSYLMGKENMINVIIATKISNLHKNLKIFFYILRNDSDHE